MKMGWNEPWLELFPIILSSIVAAISALIKFKRYNEQQEVLVQSCTVLTSTLSKARNSIEVDEDLLREYHEALELLETSLYPDVRKRFLKTSQKNLVSIIANEDEYFDLIKKAKSGEDISEYRSDKAASEKSGNDHELSEDNIERFQSDIQQTKKEEITVDKLIEQHETVDKPIDETVDKPIDETVDKTVDEKKDNKPEINVVIKDGVEPNKTDS